jgi:protease-4
MAKRKISAIAIVLILVVIVSVMILIASSVPLPGVKRVGVIEIYGYIESEEVRDNVVRMIDYAIKDGSIKAVVLKIDSPGGWVDAIEEIYLNLLKLREKKPVVAAVVGYGASGGYHIAIASNFIYATPTAMVGNIGVIGRLPYRVWPSELYVETGPQKLTGFSEKEFYFKIQEILERFINAVREQRKNKLLIDNVEMSKGLIYFGADAAKNGLVDNTGSSFDAIEKAAELAGIKEYEVVVVNSMLREDYSSAEFRSSLLTLADLDRLVPPPAFHYVYLPTAAEKPKIYDASTGENMGENVMVPEVKERGNIVLVDYSHNNMFHPLELNILLSELVKRGYTLRYAGKGENLAEKLEGVKAFLVIAPWDAFSGDEIEAVKKFVEDNGKLLLITDPSREYARAINSLSADFGVVFANGYLYSLEESYGNYRNIYVKDFREFTVTKNIQKLVLFTAAHIYSNGNGIAFTSDKALSSEGEKQMKFSPMALAHENRVLAIGDFTFMTEPYCYIESNFQLVANVADFLTGD